jgi:hypothetical protein
MIKNYHIKHLPINNLFKGKQEHIYILNLNYNYNQLIKKYGFDYEIWEETEGFMIGGAIEIDENKYLLKAALNHSKQHSLVGVYVLADSTNLQNAIEKFIKALDLNLDNFNKI